MPIYNTERYLSRCLESVLSQSFTDFELLLINDGSTDSSGAICDAYAEKDNRIRVFHKENGGVSSARNLGLENALGEWLYFIDSDDVVLPDGLQTLVDNTDDEVDVVMGGYDEVDEKGRIIQDKADNKQTRWGKKQSVITMYAGYGLNGRYWGYLWMRLFRRDVIVQHNIRFDSDIAIKEDTLFAMQYVCRSNGITQVTTKPVYRYWLRPDSAMGNTRLGFDYNYVSSIYACVKMKHEVETVFPKFSEAVFVAKQGVFGRYDTIVAMMEEYRVKDEGLKEQLSAIMRQEIGSIFLFKMRRKLGKWEKSNRKYIE